MSLADAAAKLKVSVRAIHFWIHKGQLPAVVTGGGKRRIYLLRIADVTAFVLPKRGRPPAEQYERAPGKPRAERKE